MLSYCNYLDTNGVITHDYTAEMILDLIDYTPNARPNRYSIFWPIIGSHFNCSAFLGGVFLQEVVINWNIANCAFRSFDDSPFLTGRFLQVHDEDF